jgi:nickel transport system ATP-binding protein
MNLIELKSVCKSYRQGGIFNTSNSTEVLKNIDLSIAPGACIGLLGRSGSGKSTMGRLVLGLEKPDSGDIRYDGKSILSMTRAEYREFRRNVQVVFQNSLGSVNPRFTASQIIAEPLLNFESYTSRALARKIGGLMEQVGLAASDADKFPHQFSGGELQRICIARAVSLAPRLIVLDEAVSSLDMLIQAQVLKLLRDLQQDTGVSYLFISHDIRIVAGFCDEVAIMDRGRISSMVENLIDDDRSNDPILKQLANSILPPWPRLAN